MSPVVSGPGVLPLPSRICCQWARGFATPFPDTLSVGLGFCHCLPGYVVSGPGVLPLPSRIRCQWAWGSATPFPDTLSVRCMLGNSIRQASHALAHTQDACMQLRAHTHTETRMHTRSGNGVRACIKSQTLAAAHFCGWCGPLRADLHGCVCGGQSSVVAESMYEQGTKPKGWSGIVNLSMTRNQTQGQARSDMSACLSVCLSARTGEAGHCDRRPLGALHGPQVRGDEVARELPGRLPMAPRNASACLPDCLPA
jgi:hypothetical protein